MGFKKVIPMGLTSDDMMASKNSHEHWNSQWDERFQSGWVKNKGKYRLLRRLFPRLILRWSPRKRYYLGVAKLVEGRFCDLGCGIGAVAGIYSLISGKRSYGLDHSFVAMKLGSSEASFFNLRCSFAVGNICSTGFKDKTFDTVYIGQVLEHLHDDKEVIREALRILRPGGKLIVSVPIEDRIPDPDHVRIYTKGSLQALLERFKLNYIEFHDIDPRRFVVSCRLKK